MTSMSIDLPNAEHFILTHGRLLERQRMALLVGKGGRDAVLQALNAYQNPDGGYGQALEPDVRSPNSETTATLTALEVLEDVDALSSPAAARALTWVGTVTREDGGIPFLLAPSLDYPRAPWMALADEGSHLTFGFTAVARRTGSTEPWVPAATRWCWSKLDKPEQVNGHLFKYALAFLDAHGDDVRTHPTLKALSRILGDEGGVPVPGGTANETLTPLTLSPRPELASRGLFADRHIHADLDRLAAAQQHDGGWTFDWLEWCPAQGLDWRGIQTVQAVGTLRLHGLL